MAGDLDGFQFLAWLVPFIYARQGKTNVSEQDQELGQRGDDANQLDDLNEELNLPPPLDLDDSIFSVNHQDSISDPAPTPSKIGPSFNNKHIPAPSKSDACMAKSDSLPSEYSQSLSKVTGKPKWRKGEKSLGMKVSQVEVKEMEFLDSVTKMIEKGDGISSNNADNAFGNLVSSNLSQLPKRLKLACQNEMHNIMFKYMMAAENENSPQANINTEPTYTGMVNKNTYFTF